MKNKIVYGGQAVMEGVMMRSTDKYAICVRTPDKKITSKTEPIVENQSVIKIPIIRGMYRFWQMLVIGIKSITYSANESLGEEESTSGWEIWLTVLFSVGMTILLFYVLPLLIVQFLTPTKGLLFNLLDGITRIGIFLIYLISISFLPDIKRIFQYHGAEHKTVHCVEHKKPLTVKNVQTFSTLHPRCGTNFILIVFVVSILTFSLIPTENYLSRLLLRILLLPIIAGVSYEILRFAGRHFDKLWVRIVIYPGLMLQKITTKEPTDDMVEVAIKAMKAVL